MSHVTFSMGMMSHRALALFVAIVLVGTTHASMTFNWREYSSSDPTCTGSVYRSFTLTSSSTPVSGQGTAEREFGLVDSDPKNGAISKAEFVKAYELTLETNVTTFDAYDEESAAEFDRVDTNKDGELSKAEYEAAYGKEGRPEAASEPCLRVTVTDTVNIPNVNTVQSVTMNCTNLCSRWCYGEWGGYWGCSPGCGGIKFRVSSSCSSCDGLAFVASAGICTGCIGFMNDDSMLSYDASTPITQDNVGNLSLPAEMCTSPDCTFQMYASADCSGSALSNVVSTSHGTNSGQCLAEPGDDEYIKNTMTVSGCNQTSNSPTSNSAAKHFTLSIVTMIFALLLQGVGHF